MITSVGQGVEPRGPLDTAAENLDWSGQPAKSVEFPKEIKSTITV